MGDGSRNQPNSRENESAATICYGERTQEITRNKTRKAALYEKEEKLAPPEDRAKLVAQHKVELKKLDEAVAAERAKQSEILAAAEMAGEKDLGAKQAKRDEALKDRR